MITDLQKAITGEQLDGWLFFNFHHRDPLSDRILDIDPNKINSRAWYYLVPARGEASRICHAVEHDQLEHLPGRQLIYSSRDELFKLLKEECGKSGPAWGAQFSTELTAVSTLDHGTALMLSDAGLHLRSSAGLIQRLCGLIDPAGMESHEKAAAHLYEIVKIIWARISEYFTAEEDKHPPARALMEREVQQWILDEFKTRNMLTEHMPIVACGRNSGNPHYAPENHDNPVTADSVLQLDLWAKLNGEKDIFADISWIGYTGRHVPVKAASVFEAVVSARDRCAAFISERLNAGIGVTGFEADRETRAVLIERGYENLIKHRTGHGIDISVHGSGVGLDSIEFPDERRLLEGSCFSIEPGLYSADFGMRTEIDAYIRDGCLIIPGPGPQTKILTITRT